jgi:hypothetical protein
MDAMPRAPRYGIAVMLLATTMVASTVSAQAPIDLYDLADYRLTAPVFEQFVQASGRIAEITRSDVAFNFAPLFTKDVALDGDVVAMATGLTARLENHTGLAAALESAKLTPREYSKFAIALVAAHLAHGFMKAGVLQRVPEGAPTNNVEFVKAHEVEINDVLAQLGIRD